MDFSILFDIDWEKASELFLYDSENPMNFSSGFFMFLFLGFLLCYCALQKTTTLRIVFVTLFSYYFYYKSCGSYVILLFLVTFSDFLIGYFIGENNRKAKLVTEEDFKTRQVSANRLLVGLSILIDVGLLVYFKYTNFFGIILSGGQWDMLNIIMPIGISFLVFQSMTYTLDIYRGKLSPTPHFLDYAFFVSFFPKLLNGPISRARDFLPQVRKPLHVSKEMFGTAVFLIIIGIIKKSIIADSIGENLVAGVFSAPDQNPGIVTLIGTYGYALQLYCDFSGYSDIAIGIGLLMGFTIMKNFDAPYKSQSITELWRRWHISLSSWLRDYVYISLGGNRHGLARQCLNVFLVMVVCGIWHGNYGALTFIIWGAFHGLLLVVEKLYMVYRRKSDPTFNIANRSKGFTGFLRTFITFHLCLLGWVFFNSMPEASDPLNLDKFSAVMSSIFDNFKAGEICVWFEERWAIALLLVFGFVVHFLPSRWSDEVRGWITNKPLIVKVLLIVLTIYILYQVKSDAPLPNIYYNN